MPLTSAAGFFVLQAVEFVLWNTASCPGGLGSNDAADTYKVHYVCRTCRKYLLQLHPTVYTCINANTEQKKAQPRAAQIPG